MTSTSAHTNLFSLFRWASYAPFVLTDFLVGHRWVTVFPIEREKNEDKTIIILQPSRLSEKKMSKLAEMEQIWKETISLWAPERGL